MIPSEQIAGSPQASVQPGRLLEGWPHLSLGHFPTPVRELSRLRKHLGCRPRLWIKNDDYSGPASGGTKARKLEYFLALRCCRKGGSCTYCRRNHL
jgi:hypothetical protein